MNLVFIFGNCRSGKSFMMNCLAGTRGVFDVVNTADPCTVGVDVSNHFVALPTLLRRAERLAALDDKSSSTSSSSSLPLPPPSSSNLASAKKSEDRTLVGFVDVEGQGAQDNLYDTKLALPLLLTSKIVLFNHKGAPTVANMLAQLGVLAKSAEYIEIGGDETKGTEGVSATKAKTGGVAVGVAAAVQDGGSAKQFGHLHVLFRDFSFEGTVDSVYSQLMGMEVEPSAPAGKAGGNKLDRDRQLEAIKVIQERNRIRDLLLDNFESIHVWLFKQPASADDLKSHRELPEDVVDPEFVQEVNRLSIVLASQLRQPTLFGGSAVTGPKVQTLLTQITASLNVSGSISVPSVFRAMENEQASAVLRECENAWTAVVSRLKKTLPTAAETLSNETKESAAKVLRDFDAQLADCVLVEDRDRKRSELVATIGRDVASLEADNAARVLAALKDVTAESCAASKQAFEIFCGRVIPVEDKHVIDAEFQSTVRRHGENVRKKLGVFGSAVEALSEYKLCMMESEEVLTEFYMLKLAVNDARVKDGKISDLITQSEKQQSLLIEQGKALQQQTEDLQQELIRIRASKTEEEKQVAEFKERNAAILTQLEESRAEIAKLKAKKKTLCVVM